LRNQIKTKLGQECIRCSPYKNNWKERSGKWRIGSPVANVAQPYNSGAVMQKLSGAVHKGSVSKSSLAELLWPSIRLASM
jgi:hypothetical protein